MKTVHGIIAIVVSITVLNVSFAQDYKPGQAVEYHAYGTWERGAILRTTNNGKQYTRDDQYYNELQKLGANVTTVFHAIDNNYGKVPTVEDYHGTYMLWGAKRGVKTLSKAGTKLIQITEDAQMEAGAITINKDGTFVWKLGRNDSEDKWLKGKWRVAKDSERVKTEGGTILVLEKARQGEDYHMRKYRSPDYENWIEVGRASNRAGVHYGRPVQ